MESCGVCVSGWNVSLYLNCYGLWPYWVSLSFPITHYVTQTTPPSLSLTQTLPVHKHHRHLHKWNWLGDNCQCLWRGPSFRSSLVSPVDRELKSSMSRSESRCLHPCFFFLAPSSRLCSATPLPVLKQTFQNTLPYAANTPDLIHQAIE